MSPIIVGIHGHMTKDNFSNELSFSVQLYHGILRGANTDEVGIRFMIVDERSLGVTLKSLFLLALSFPIKYFHRLVEVVEMLRPYNLLLDMKLKTEIRKASSWVDLLRSCLECPSR